MIASNDLTPFFDGSIFLDTRFGKPRYYLTPPEDFKMRIPEDHRKSVAYVGIQKQDKSQNTYMFTAGTAFFIHIESKRHKGVWFYYLVTAAHVAELLDGDPTSWVRLNTIGGTSEYVQIGKDRRWSFHSDPEVDVAVLPFAPNADIFEFRSIREDVFIKQEFLSDEGIGAGDEVAIIGLFSRLEGTQKMLPIVRMGAIAMIPPSYERVQTNWTPKKSIGTKARVEGYLIEARSIEGISGAPVFVVRMELHPPSSPQAASRIFFRSHLLGLMHGHWYLEPGSTGTASNEEPSADLLESNRPINMGIAIVTPTHKLLETINLPQLEHERSRYNDWVDMTNAVTPDRSEDKMPIKDIPFTRDDFMRDLNKVVQKKPKSDEGNTQT